MTLTTRREFSLGVSVAVGFGVVSDRVRADEGWSEHLQRQFAEIETRSAGRLGVGVLDTHTGRVAARRGRERFPMCSTYKAISVAALLARVDRGEERLDRRVRFPPDGILPYSPATQWHAGEEGMTLSAICEAAITLSDNTAANLILDAIGGPAAFNAFVRGLRDEITRLDRTEPSLNEARPGDPRDTTCPLAMTANLNRLVLGDALTPASRDRLTTWLVGCNTGAARLRAGTPDDWRIGDKTGSGEHGTANDIGVCWPPHRRPVIVSVYITGSRAPAVAQDEAIAEVARTVARSLG